MKKKHFYYLLLSKVSSYLAVSFSSIQNGKTNRLCELPYANYLYINNDKIPLVNMVIILLTQCDESRVWRSE